jgi:putative oxidoreductase
MHHLDQVMNVATRYAPLVGRAFLAFLFLQSGWLKMFEFGKTAAVMTAKGVPMAQAALLVTIVILLAGGLMLLVGWHARWAALALFVWMVPVTLLYHAFWSAEPAQLTNQVNHFLKNLALMGALLVIAGIGSGPLSLDRLKPGAVRRYKNSVFRVKRIRKRSA